MLQLLDGKALSIQIKEEIANEVRRLTAAGKRPPHLAAVIVGNDGASQTYVANKEKSSHEVGFTSSVYRYSENTSEKDLLEAINFLNAGTGYGKAFAGVLYFVINSLAFGASEFLGVIEHRQYVRGLEYSGTGHHRARQRAATHFVDAHYNIVRAKNGFGVVAEGDFTLNRSGDGRHEFGVLVFHN